MALPDCFPKSQALLPKVLAIKDIGAVADPKDEFYRSIVSGNDFVIYGGTASQDLFYSYEGETETVAGVITRMDLE